MIKAQIAIREIIVSRNHDHQINGLPETPRTLPHCDTEGLRGLSIGALCRDGFFPVRMRTNLSDEVESFDTNDLA